MPWEVLVVDHASIDETAAVARRCWPRDHPVPLRVAVEAMPESSNARLGAFRKARYEFPSFLDDDWVDLNWLQQAAEIMTEHTDVAASFAKKAAV